MKSIIKIVSITLFSLTILITPLSYAEDKDKHKHHQEVKEDGSGVEALSPELRELLTKEMLAIQNGMMAIIPAYSSGNWEEIEGIAQKIKDSYILKQSLTDEQVKELHSLLPASFIKQDQQFHYLSGMLAHVAKSKKPELVGFYFSKMNEACVSCHTEYAPHRFPALVPTKETPEHSHQ